ncbi:MAG TPA: deoxyribose-phosphate aldolase, partial [Phaeodactylibacter sp.]|nr:deoxyribose-phosphate aldolase [Phaeodactylibacter sp.]
EYHFAAVCIPPYFCRLAGKLLQGSEVEVCTVIGFPMGYSHTVAKVEEIKRAIIDSADHVDIVVNVSAVKDGDWRYVENDIEATVRTAQLKDTVAKLIFETSRLTAKEIQQLCKISVDAGADYIKTSTGFDGQRADLNSVKLMRRFGEGKVKIKASGGIRTKEDALVMIEAGADRLGTSSGVKIVTS